MFYFLDSPPIRPPRTDSDSDKLLIGKLISQGSSRSELVGAARQQGVGPSQIEEVKVRFAMIRLSEKIFMIQLKNYLYSYNSIYQCVYLFIGT